MVLQIIMNVIDLGMNVAEASAAPRMHHQWLPDNVITERGISPDTLRLLEERGFTIPHGPDGRPVHRILGRANTIMKQSGYLFGAADRAFGRRCGRRILTATERSSVREL